MARGVCFLLGFRVYLLLRKPNRVYLFWLLSYFTSREVNEARGGLILAAGRVRSKERKNRKKEKHGNIRPSENEIHSSPATASNSRRHARKHVPRVSPYFPASKNPGFVEIGPVQLSQSVKTTNVTHTHRQTN